MKIDRGGWAGGRFAITIVGDLLLEYERYVSLGQVHSRGRRHNEAFCEWRSREEKGLSTSGVNFFPFRGLPLRKIDPVVA